MIGRRRRARPLPWSREELAILCDVHPEQGIEGAADALPERSARAIIAMASKLALRSPFLGQGRQAVLAGPALERAIEQRERLGWSFMRIGQANGISDIAAQNAVLMALCPRRGFTPAARDHKGKLTPIGVARLQDMLREGRKGVDISLELGVSAARVALERRTMNAARAAGGTGALPPPGNGERYSGAKIDRDVRAQVDQLLLQGYGAPRIAELTQVSRTHVGRRRNQLVKRLARNGQCLPGCDKLGKRLHFVDSVCSVTDAQKALFREELMKGTPVARAARIAVIGGSFAYQLRDALKAELEARGAALPTTKRLGRNAGIVDRALAWLPKGRKSALVYRRHLRAAGGDFVEAKRRTIAELMPKPPAPAAPRRPLTFEEQLARVESGQARVIAKVPMRRADYHGTLGGVATGML